MELSPLLKQSRQGADIAELLEQSHGSVERHRGQLWRHFLCVDSLKEDLFQHLLKLPLDDDRVIFAEACIQKDLDRVFPHCFGQARAEYCRKKYLVLLAYAQRCPDIGYESGMHFIAGVLLAVMDAEDAFWCLCSIIALRLDGFLDLQQELCQVEPGSTSVFLYVGLNPAHRFPNFLESFARSLSKHG
eukprot:s1292_g6.t1